MVSKKIEEGALYNKKLRVIDVHDSYTFSCVPLSGNKSLVYTTLKEKHIETVIPRTEEQN